MDSVVSRRVFVHPLGNPTPQAVLRNLVAGRLFIRTRLCSVFMSSRADSASPPPYSYESSSFAPPPPRVGEVSRSWDFQMKFEAAHEDVRWALRAPQFLDFTLSNSYVS